MLSTYTNNLKLELAPESKADKLYSNINVTPLLDEVMLYYDRFDENQYRSKIPELSQSKTIPLTRHTSHHLEILKSIENVRDRQTYAQNQKERVPSKYYNDYPLIVNFLTEFTKKYGGSLVGASIILLPAGCRVSDHFDWGKYYIGRSRFHLVLTGEYQYTVQGQTNVFTAGDLWWFDNSEHHSAYNHTTKDRISVIFDVEGMERVLC